MLNYDYLNGGKKVSANSNDEVLRGQLESLEDSGFFFFFLSVMLSTSHSVVYSLQAYTIHLTVLCLGFLCKCFPVL